MLPIRAWVCAHPLGHEQPPSSHILRGGMNLPLLVSIIPLIGWNPEEGDSFARAGILTNPTFNVLFQPK